MMDERKLNINAPLISVRRSSATTPSLFEAMKKIVEKQKTLPNYKSDMTLDQVTEPVAVPFNWEHIPGRCKGNGGSEPQPPNQVASVTPTPNKSNSFNGCVNKIDCDKERKEENKGSNVEEDDDDVYSDALDTLSPTKSFSMNCSLSGVSGLDNSDAKNLGTFSTDKQAQDFMMSRFLPAAKAMTLQPPQHASRKQSLLVEQLRDVNKLACEEKKPLVKKHITDIVPYTGQRQEQEESGDEADDDQDESANISAKGCGLFPRLRGTNSLCLLNPVPGMKMRNQFPMSSAYEVEKPNKSSHIRSYSSAPSIKKAWDAIHKSKTTSGAASPVMQEVRKKWTSASNRFTYSGELHQSGRLSPFRRSRAAGAGISPCRSKPQSPFRGARLLGDSKEDENNLSGKMKFHSRGHGNIQEIPSQGAKKNSNSGNLTIEKTLYIDTASTMKLTCSNSCSADKTQRISNSEISSSMHAKSSMIHLMAKEDKAKCLTTDQEINKESVSLQLMKRSFYKDSKINNQQIVVFDDSEKVAAESFLSHLPPPLPKSPSESWLRRALPIVSSKNSFLHSNHGTQFHSERKDINTTSNYTKWETIVKTSNLHHDHVRYSQELTIHKSQHSKS